MKTPTIYEIKRATAETAPCFFSRKTMKFFNQTLKDFSVTKAGGGKFLISAAFRREPNGKICGYTQRFFNPTTNKLETV